MAVHTFLEEYDFSGKTIVPFVTHGTGGRIRYRPVSIYLIVTEDPGTMEGVIMRKLIQLLLAGILIASLTACGNNAQVEESLESADPVQKEADAGAEGETGKSEPKNQQMAEIPDGFILIKGGTFDMGSPESEAWRSEDEVQHSVTVSDFYMGVFEVTQAEYQSVMGNNPSNFTGDNLPVENISWLDAVAYCNARSEAEGLTPVYTMEGSIVSWDRSANGY